jgi:hypothetical protein
MASRGFRPVPIEAFEAAGPRSWPCMHAHSALDRFMFRRPGAHYLHARGTLEEMEDRPNNVIRIKVKVRAIEIDHGGEDKTWSIGSFVHTVTDTDLEVDATRFHRELHGFLRRNFSSSPEKDLRIGLHYSDANGAISGRKTYLKYVVEPWI